LQLFDDSFDSSVGGDRVTLKLDTAAASAIGDTDLDVAVSTPTGSPGVLDHVVLLTVRSTVADSENSVIKVGSAAGADNSRGVVSEHTLVSFNSDSDRSLGYGTLESRGGFTGDSAVALDRDNTLGRGSFARTILSGVGVGGFGFHGMRFSVLERTALVTTVAAIAIGVAVNKLLLGERNKLASGLVVGTFHGTS